MGSQRQAPYKESAWSLWSCDEGSKEPKPIIRNKRGSLNELSLDKKGVSYRLKGSGWVKNQLLSPGGRDWGFLHQRAYSSNHKSIALFYFTLHSQFKNLSEIHHICSLLLSQVCWTQPDLICSGTGRIFFHILWWGMLTFSEAIYGWKSVALLSTLA